MKSKLYRELAQLLMARNNCIGDATKKEWLANHTGKIISLVENCMPSGSGIDCGTIIDMHESTPEKLVFVVSFHHMNDCGMYDGWTEHTIIVKPSLAFGFTMRITGKDRNGIKDYLHDVYNDALNTEIEL